LLSQIGILIIAGAKNKYAILKASANAKILAESLPVNQIIPTNARPIQNEIGSLPANPKSVGATV
jgi:hypothetical protein